ncbi:MAG: hypothetical protein ISF22_03730 [Methanomassiliicoccus sp.]|nr:hypothetical protein [Methanomassiliicoccus sp.]
MDAKFSANAKDLLGKRGLKEADVADVINTATTSKRRITNGKECLAKKRIGEVTVYALYDASGDIKSAYSHRMVLGEPVKTTETPEVSEWECVHCKEKAIQGTVNMTYMGITRSGPAIVCPKCGDSWVEEYLATKTIAAAEGLFEKKKA